MNILKFLKDNPSYILAGLLAGFAWFVVIKSIDDIITAPLVVSIGIFIAIVGFTVGMIYHAYLTYKKQSK